jgi:hypothetical protein
LFRSPSPLVRVIRSGKKRNTDLPTLAEESFRAFEPFLNIFDPGRRGTVCPYHTIARDTWTLHAQYKDGLKPHHEDGRPFHPFFDVKRHVYSVEHVQQHLDRREVGYYTSGKHGKGLLYLDVDAHHDFQTDEHRARELLQQVLPAYWRTSRRGQNGYVKVQYERIGDFNKLAEFEAHVRRWLRSHGVLCDFEIKGTITTEESSGRLAKLPFGNKCPCDMRDESDSWNFTQLMKFEESPVLNPAFVKRQFEKLVVDEDKAAFYEAKVQALKAADSTTECPTPISGSIPSSPRPTSTPSAGPTSPKPSVTTIGLSKSKNIEDIRKLPNAYERSIKSVLYLQTVLRRPATVDEAIAFYEDNELHSAPLANPARRGRFERIVKIANQKFDGSKLGTQGKVSQQIDEIVRVIEAQRRQVKECCPRHLDWKDYGVVLGIATYCCGKNPDNSIPEDWVTPILEELKKRGIVQSSDVRQIWRPYRNVLDQQKVITNDHLHWRDRALRYDKGENFPEPGKSKAVPYTYPIITPHTTTLQLGADSTLDLLVKSILEECGVPPPRGSPK